MASLLSFGGIKKKDNVLNTLSNYDVRTNNAVVNNANTSSIANRNQPARVSNSSPTISQPKNTASTLKTLSNLNARTPSFNTEVKQISPVKNTLNKLNQLNQSQNSFNTDANNNTNKLDFNQYKVAKTANTAINGNNTNNNTNTPFKTNTLNNANTISTVKNFFSKPQTQPTEQSVQKTADTLNKVRDSFKPSEEYTKTMNTAVGSTLSGKNPDVNFIGFADKAFKSTGNTFDNTSNYKTMLDAYNKASGNQQADIKKSINDQIINMRELAKQGNTTALKAVDYLTELGGALDRYGNYKGKSLGRQVWDELSTGGFIGDIGGNRLTQFLGNVFGKGDEVAAQLEKQANARDDLGAVGVVNDAAAGVGNFALNYGTAGAYGAANAGVGALNTMQGHNRKVMDYDENGNAYIRNKTDRERLGEWGQSALDAAFAAAGVAGVGPSLGTKALESGAKLGLRDIVKYAAAELPWAGATTYLQEGLGNLSQNRNFNDINAGQFAKDLALNLGQDIGMDVANYNIGKMGQRGADTRLNYDNSGNAVKTNPDGTTSRLSDSELAKAATENTPTTLRERVQNSANALNRTLTGQNNLTPAYASVDVRTSSNASPDARTNISDLTPVRQDSAAHRVGDEIHLDGPGMKYEGGDNAEDRTQFRKDVKEGVNERYRNEDPTKNIELKTSDGKTVTINNKAVQKLVSGNYDKVVRFAETIDDLSDLLKLSERINAEADSKGKHGFAKEWNEYVARRVRLSDGNLYDITHKVATDGDNDVLYYQQQGRTPYRSVSDNDLTPAGSSSSLRLRNPTSNIPQTPDNVNRSASDIIAERTFQNRQNNTPNRATNNLDTTELSSLAKRAENGDTEALRTLEELGLTPVTEESSDWRGKNVDEVINPEKTANRDVENGLYWDEENNIGVKIETDTERNQKYDKKIKKYYEKYGEDFYEKMPDALQDRYDELVDQAPRDAEGRYTDPITGGVSIDERSNMREDDALVKRNEVVAKLRELERLAVEDPSSIKDLLPLEAELIVADPAAKGVLGEPQSIASKAIDNLYSMAINKNAVDRLTIALDNALSGEGNAKDITFVRLTENMLSNINEMRKAQGKNILSKRKVKAFAGAIDNHLDKHLSEYGSTRAIAQAAYDVLTRSDTLVLPGNTERGNKGTLLANRNTNDNFIDSVVVGDTESGDTSLKSVSPRSSEQIRSLSSEREKLLNADLVGGNDSLHPIPDKRAAGFPNSAQQASLDISDSSIPQNTQNYNISSGKSKFAENTSQNQAFSTETREALKSDPLGYTPTTNAERLARANEIISTKSTDEVDTYLRDNFFNVKDKNRNSGDVVLAGEFAKMLDAKGQYDRSTEIINKMSAIASRQGQEIQALSLMMNRSPEGIANMAQSAIKKGGGEMTGELRGKIVKKTQEIGRIRAEKNNLTLESNRIGEQIMNGEGDLPALRKRQMEIAQEYRQNMDAEGRTFSELSDIVSKNSPDNRSIFGSVYRASLLSGPRTHTGNLVSNTFQNVSLKSIVKSKSPKQRWFLLFWCKKYNRILLTATLG